MKVLRPRLYDMKLKEQQAELDRLGGEKKEIAFGSQIRSYVLQPYQMVKDHRTQVPGRRCHARARRRHRRVHQDVPDGQVVRHARPGDARRGLMPDA